MYCDLLPYVWLVFKSGFKSRAGYSGTRMVMKLLTVGITTLKKKYTHQFKMPANKKASICWHFSIFCLYSYLQPEWSVWFLSIVACLNVLMIYDISHQIKVNTYLCILNSVIFHSLYFFGFPYQVLIEVDFDRECNIFVIQEAWRQS